MAILGIIVSSLVTLAAAGLLTCPTVVCGPAAPVTTTVEEPLGLSLAPTQGPVQTQLVLTLTGFGPNEAVTITFGGYRIAHPIMDPTGGASAISVSVPDSFAANGDQVMTLAAQGDTSGRVATTTFHLTAA